MEKPNNVEPCALVNLLVSSGMSLEQIAESVGSSWRSVLRWSKGEAAPLPVHHTLLVRLANERASKTST